MFELVWSGKITSMRLPRIKVPKGEDGLYHCMSRIVGGDYIFGVREKECFISMMWRLAEFLGIDVLDYTVMSNHYHQLAFVPGVIELNDLQLLDRLKAYYGAQGEEFLCFREALISGGRAAELLRERHLKRMGDISDFEGTLKQTFSTWYNRQQDRRGTLWMERFKSVLVEDSPDALGILATYIDLNPVRANMVEDPKNYRFCGYGAAMGGDLRCRRGIMRVMGMDSWEEASAAYRVFLMKRGHAEAISKTGKISRELLLKTLKEEGKLPHSELMRLRVRYFSDGLVLGSELFVEKVFQQYRSHFGEKRKSGSRPINGLSDSPLCVIRDLRNSVFS